VDKHEYEYEKLVVGGSLASLVYAYHESLPIIWTEPRLPHFFDKTKNGQPKLEIWKRMAFLLSLSGLAPFGNKVDSYREEDGLLKVFGKEPYYVKVKAKEVEYYDECLVEKENTILEIIDWVNVRSGLLHPHDYLGSEDDFVKHVHFYVTPRIDGEHPFKDAVTLSYMTRKQLLDDDHSETYVRLKLLDMMREAGIKGTGNGSYKGKKKHLSLRVEPTKREARVCDTEREDALLEKYWEKDPPQEQTAMWADILGDPYERD